jgi:23S rRNA (cytosine1962-C5)-methyltransferase
LAEAAGKKGRAFDVVVLDPPTFSQSKEHGVFRAEKDYGKLVALALPLLKTGGFCLPRPTLPTGPQERFLASVAEPIRAARRKDRAATLRAPAAGFSHQPRRSRPI